MSKYDKTSKIKSNIRPMQNHTTHKQETIF